MAAMTKKERVKTALKGEAVDRPPASFWRHFYESETTAEGLADAMLGFQRKYDWDFVKVNPRASYHVEGWGVALEFSGQPHVAPKRLDYPVKSSADWARIRPLPLDQGPLAEQLKALQLIKEGLKGEAFFVETIFSPLSIAGDLVGSSGQLQKDLRESPATVHQALQVITETFAPFAQRCLEVGASGIFFATTDWASYDLLTDREYDEFGRAYDLQVLKNVQDGADLNVLHVCKDHNMLFALADYPVHAINWDATSPTNPNLKQGLEKCRQAVIGGIDRHTLRTGTPDDVVAEVERAKEMTGGHRWMLGPSCSIPTESREENLRAARAALASS